MKNVFLISVLFYHSVFLTYSDIINDGLPQVVSECDQHDKIAQHDCINSNFKNTEWIKNTDADIQLRVQQKFYWHPTKRLRRECRAVPREEWRELMDAINALKQDKSLSPNVYDYFADYHTKKAVDSIHFGSNFFGWHRCYILKFEELLRKINPNVSLCYWDSRLDQVMRHPHQSKMFTDEFMGNMHGPVTSGPFGGWKTIRNIPLRRDMGKSGALISPQNIKDILSKKHHVQITTPTADPDTNVESMHNGVHAYVGGQMNDFNTSSQDPFFWFHHCFIDYVWELFCTKLRKSGIDPQDDYVIIQDEKHQPDRIMDHLFPLKNIDGYSDYFPRNIYDYQKYATCPHCLGSPNLKCDHTINECRCIEKNEPLRIVPTPLKRIETNHLSQPQEHIDILSGSENINKWVFVPIKLVFRDAIHKSIRQDDIVGCEYAHTGTDLCSGAVAIVQSHGMTYHGTYRNYIVNDVSIPQWTYAYVGVKNPELGPSQAFISITNKMGEPCVPYCLTKNEEKYRSCPGIISVTSDKPKMYSNTLEDARASGFSFNPLEADTLDRRIKMAFLCY